MIPIAQKKIPLALPMKGVILSTPSLIHFSNFKKFVGGKIDRSHQRITFPSKRSCNTFCK